MKALKFPTALISGDYLADSLLLNGGSLIDQCITTAGEKGTFFLEQHLLYIVLNGTVSLTHGQNIYTLHKNEMILLCKAHSLLYEKTVSDETHQFESLLFAITDDLLSEFLNHLSVALPSVSEIPDTRAVPMSPKLITYCQSLLPYFGTTSAPQPHLLRIKIMELFYDVMESSDIIFKQMLWLHRPVKTNIPQVMETHYNSPLTLENLAYLSGRSLSSFKRDFISIYGIPPAQWIREKRLRKAYELLQTTSLPIADLVYQLGFENASHFSRIFKQFFGVSPSAVRSNKELLPMN